MSKKYIPYKILLLVLKGLVYVKRAVFWSGKVFGRGFKGVHRVYTKTIGFFVYKTFFHFGRFIKKHFFVHKYGTFEVIGQRGALQLILFLVIFFIVVPQSKLYTKEYTQIPGRQTLFYKLVGPGDLEFELEAVSGDSTSLDIAEGPALWKEGSIIAQPDTGTDRSSAVEPQELATVSIGGNAINKPIISPSADVESLAADASASNKNRNKIIEYLVQPGDVVGNIAKKYGISVSTILSANNLSTRSYIRPGDKLKILPTDGVTYKVKSGDTISAIAKKYNTEAEKIIAFNKLAENGSDIVIGEQLILPGGKAPVPVRKTIVRKPTPSKNFKNVVAPPPSVSAPAGSGYIWPSAATIITQYYGWRHTGLDVAGAMGSAIYASRSGRVTTSKCGWNGGYGCYIIIDHLNGVSTLYAHNTKLYVSVGETVSQGQTIALMGSTGRSTGPHIHFEVRVNGRRANPLQYVRK